MLAVISTEWFYDVIVRVVIISTVKESRRPITVVLSALMATEGACTFLQHTCNKIEKGTKPDAYFSPPNFNASTFANFSLCRGSNTMILLHVFPQSHPISWAVDDVRHIALPLKFTTALISKIESGNGSAKYIRYWAIHQHNICEVQDKYDMKRNTLNEPSVHLLTTSVFFYFSWK